jgi:hypothetical protein
MQFEIPTSIPLSIAFANRNKRAKTLICSVGMSFRPQHAYWQSFFTLAHQPTTRPKSP